MAYSSTATAPERRNPTGKNRVWDFFRLSNETHPVNRRQPLQPRRKIRSTPTKTASGIPYWPSRVPIEEVGGENLYGFISNEAISKLDRLGLFAPGPPQSDPVKAAECEDKAKKISESDLRIIGVINKLKVKQCVIPDVVCQCCEGEGLFEAEYRRSVISTRIVMCTDQGVDKGSKFEDVLYHEYQHSLQFCARKEKNSGSFEEALCNEIGAYATANCNHHVDDTSNPP
jgi:hypothetical protein